MGGKQWTKREIEILKANYAKMSASELSKLLRRPADSIWVKAKSLGVRKRTTRASKGKNGERPIQDASYTNVCACVLDGLSFEEIAKLTNRSVEQVKKIYNDGVKMGRLAAIKRYRADNYVLAKTNHYRTPWKILNVTGKGKKSDEC